MSGDDIELKPILVDNENGSDGQGESCSGGYSYSVRERCLSVPPRRISWCSVFQYFAQMVGMHLVHILP